MQLYSIGQAAEQLGVKYQWAHRWVRLLRLGRKVGWGVVLDESDLTELERKRDENGRKKAS